MSDQQSLENSSADQRNFKMKKLDEGTKFEIITEIKRESNKISFLTVPEIINWINEAYNVYVSTASIYRWAKIYDFKFKAQKKPSAPTPAEAIKQTNQRIRILGIVIRNLCKELDIQHPTILDKLIDGIIEQYGTMANSKVETQKLEETVYDKI